MSCKLTLQACELYPAREQENHECQLTFRTASGAFLIGQECAYPNVTFLYREDDTRKKCHCRAFRSHQIVYQSVSKGSAVSKTSLGTSLQTLQENLSS